MPPRPPALSLKQFCNQGNLLRGIDNCSVAALKAVRQLLTTSFTKDFSLFEFLQLFQTMLPIF